ncbi:MAG: hypothetical protein U0401_26815 [Anaerolineae bacterium]
MDDKSKRLLILACSQRKRPDPGLLPAIERYDGGSFSGSLISIMQMTHVR